MLGQERKHWASIVLVGAILAGFALELQAAPHPWTLGSAPDVATLVASGGAGRGLLLDHGEWWRLFTAAFVHGSLPHLLLNAVALALAGRLMERSWGPTWAFATFFAGAVGGAAAGVALNPPDVLSVGASGGIMALTAAALAGTARMPAGRERSAARVWLAAILAPALLPVAVHGAGGSRIDFAAHLGGAIAGAALGATLLAAPAGAAVRLAGAALALAGACGALAGAEQLTRHHDRIAAAALASGRSGLIPDAELPSNDAEALESALALAQRYPKDPRAHLFKARLHRSRGELRPAEGELRVALALPSLRAQFPERRLELQVRAELALALQAQQQIDEARREAAEVCTEPVAARAALLAAGLCP